MDLQSGYPYSLVRYGLPYNYPRLNRNMETDVLIVGGGISGALSAYYLAEAGIPCVVLDARTIGLGSTCASTSLLQYEIDVPLSELKTKVGEEQAAMAYQLCYESVSILEKISKQVKNPVFEKSDSLFVASYKKDEQLIEKEYAARKALGFELELWDADTVRQHMGFDAPAAIYSSRAAQTDAYMFTHALHQYSLQHGVEVFDRTGVSDIVHHRRGGITAKTTEGFTVKAKKLLIATGYEATKYIKDPLIELRSTYATVSESVDTCWYNNCLIWETKDPYLYMRPTNDNRILVGGRDEEFYNPTRRDKLIGSKGRSLQQDFSKRFPDIPFIPEFNWTGTFITTSDGLPFIGYYPGMRDTLFALGFGGNGITFSQIGAEVITSILQGRKHPAIELFRFGRSKH